MDLSQDDTGRKMSPQELKDLMEKSMCGGWSQAMDATEEIQKICDQMKGKVEEKANAKYVEFTAVKYRQQVVNGHKYRIKVHVGGTDYIHVGVYQSIHVEEAELLGVKQNSTKDDAL